MEKFHDVNGDTKTYQKLFDLSSEANHVTSAREFTVCDNIF